MIEPESNHTSGENERNSEKEENDLGRLRQPIHERHIDQSTDDKLDHLDPLSLLLPSQGDLSSEDDLSPRRKEVGERFYVSGRGNAQKVLDEILIRLEGLSLDHTIAVDMAQICATQDFVEGIVKPLFSPTGEHRTLSVGKQIVFFDPDPTTSLSLARAVEIETSGNAVVMIAETANRVRWNLKTVGHLEKHLEKVLVYIREQKSVTNTDIYNAERATSVGNASGAVKELWDLGLIRRTKADQPSDKVGRAMYTYMQYHPYLDKYPEIPMMNWGLLDYGYELLHSPRRKRQ